MKRAKTELTVMLPSNINYGHTIEEAEKIDAISDAMESWAQEKSEGFAEWLQVGGWRLLDSRTGEWSDGEQHCQTSELYLMYDKRG